MKLSIDLAGMPTGLFLAGGLLLSSSALGQVPAFSISIHDDRFVPSELEVPAGQKVELVVKNERAAASEFESFTLHREKVVTAGQQVTIYVGPLRPGTYEFFDDYQPQARGRLIVR